ncbi:MAG: tetratricopeptide repeat protein [Thermoanaerobaculia bacterium]|nr:tetratricopeptide repeat protein [Thermoanaerobaculia bacterium]
MSHARVLVSFVLLAVVGLACATTPAAAPQSTAAPNHEALRAEAAARVAANPADLDAWIWLGRRTAYLGRYEEAIRVYDRALELFPAEPRLYRHRGHRHLTLRQFAAAEADFERAAELMAGEPDSIEPDGLPNARNQPTSTLHANVWYHLGLARYLQRDFAGARAAYETGLAVPGHIDMDIALRYWLVVTLSRLGDSEARAHALAPVRADADIIESGDYLRLLRLFRGEGDPAELLAAAGAAGSDLSFPTVGYGVGVWYLTHGQETEARQVFRQVVAKGPVAAFGVIAAAGE